MPSPSSGDDDEDDGGDDGDDDDDDENIDIGPLDDVDDEDDLGAPVAATVRTVGREQPARVDGNTGQRGNGIAGVAPTSAPDGMGESGIDGAARYWRIDAAFDKITYW